MISCCAFLKCSRNVVLTQKIHSITIGINIKNIAQTFWGNLVHDSEVGHPSGEDSVKKYVVPVIGENLGARNQNGWERSLNHPLLTSIILKRAESEVLHKLMGIITPTLMSTLQLTINN
jgi:hypothetical protein